MKEQQDLLTYVNDKKEQDKLAKQSEEDMKQVKDEFDKKNKKRYIVIYSMAADEDERYWMPFEGRDATREFIKTVVDEIDIKTGLILVDNVTLAESLSIYKFMKVIQKYYDDGFDIEDYNN